MDECALYMLKKSLIQALEKEYETGEIIGSGTYGVILAATHKPSMTPVAIKAFINGQNIGQNYINELKLMFRLRHPHILQALDLFYVDKAYAIVFEFMNAGDLRLQMESHKFEEEEAVMLIYQIAAGLSYIHKQGIIHRDIKPENILLHRRDNQLQYKLADFNISRHTPKGELRATNCGSPIYMAPEQFYDSYDARADLYALGIVFYELLTGSPPFVGNYQDVMREHIQTTPKWENLKHFPHSRKIIQKLLAKKPSDRFDNALDLFEALEKSMYNLSKNSASPSNPIKPKPVIDWNESTQAFYLKYIDDSLWNPLQLEASPPNLRELIEKNYLRIFEFDELKQL